MDSSTLRISLQLMAYDFSGVGMGSFGGNILSTIARLGLLLNMLSGVNPQMQTLIGVTAVSGAAFMAFGAALMSSISAATTLEFTLKQVSIAVDGARANMDAMQAATINMADTTMYSNDQVGQAMVALGEHTFNAAQILYGVSAPMSELTGHAYDATAALNGLAFQSLYLGEAIHVDTTTAANLLGQALQVFSNEGYTATQVASILTGAFYHGIPSAQSMTTALTQVGGIADSLKIKLPDLLTVLDM